MNKTKTLKLFIKLFNGAMFKYLKNAFYVLGDSAIIFLGFIVIFVTFIYNLLYAILLFVIYPFRIIQVIFYAIKYRKKWATEKKYNKYFGGKDDNARTY